MVGEVVPKAELLPRARAIAQAIAENSPNAVEATKRAIWGSLNHGLDHALLDGWEVVTSFARDYDDPVEGGRAFVEKRKPRWAYRAPNKP
jgi:enoyl-CoA hydratase/carnithine racemase